jgi:hypothetical protein
MKKQIIRISLLQSAKVAAALYFVLTLPFVAIFAVMMSFAPSGSFGMIGGLAMVVIAPVMYAIFGFLFSLLGGWIYNVVAGQIGGFEYTTTEVAG